MTDEVIPQEAYALREATKIFGSFIGQMLKHSQYTQDIEEVHENVFQPSNLKNQEMIQAIANILVKPKSHIAQADNLVKLAELSKQGKSCLLLPEHYSNFDYPAFFYLSQNNPQLKDAFQNLICMAASKLNTESKAVLAVTEAYNRIFIYPARAKKENPTEQEKEEEKKLDQLNQKALKEMISRKRKGHIILVFPSGMRYRPGQPETKEALQQIMSFIKAFDYFCFVGIAGNALMVNPNNKMSQDILRKDNFVYLVDEVRSSKEFLADIKSKKNYEDRLEIKKDVAKEVTQNLARLHERAENIRSELIKDDPPEYLGPFIPPEMKI